MTVQSDSTQKWYFRGVVVRLRLSFVVRRSLFVVVLVDVDVVVVVVVVVTVIKTQHNTAHDE